jgi:transposase
MASAELNAEPEPKTIGRVEVLVGPERRRQWSAEDKERIVAESYSGNDSVSRIARRHGLLPQQLFTWRREARQSAVSPAFAAVALAPREANLPETKSAALPANSASARSGRPTKKKIGPAVTMMEIEAGGIKVRVLRDADSAVVAAIVRALKAAS